MSLRVGVLLAALCFSAGPLAANAQDYPSRPIKLLIHTPPGSLVDVLGRLVGQELGERLGQSLIIDNRVGGGDDDRSRAAEELAGGRLHADDQHVRSDNAAVPQEELSHRSDQGFHARSRWS
jgi:hypothetical protein